MYNVWTSIVNTVHKIDCYCYDMFGFLARTTALYIVLILILNSHCTLTMSPLIQPPQSTKASFQTVRPHMFQHVNTKFINPLLKQRESELLELDVSMEIEI